MLSDDDDHGFRWGRAVFGALLGLILAFIFVKVGESKWWWLFVPVSTAVFGFRLDIPWWLPWVGSNDDTYTNTRSTHRSSGGDAAATTTADSGGDGGGDGGGGGGGGGDS